MLRTLMAAAVVYAYGLPTFDGRRPKFLDKPFQSFNAAVNLAALDSQRALAKIDTARAMDYVDRYVARVKTQLRASK